MATTLALPQNFEQDVAALMPNLLFAKMRGSKSPLAEAFPFSYTEASMAKWDQYGDPFGLIPVRGVNGAPDSVSAPAMKTFLAAPGFYGLVTSMTEEEILFGRQPNTVADPLEIADRLSVLAMYGTDMVYNRFRSTIANLAVNGYFTNSNSSGEITHKYKVDNYQTFSPANDGSTGPGWAADPTNADPIGDLIYWQTNQLDKGTSADFGPDSTLVCNPSVINDMWNCTSVREKFKSRFGASVLRGELKVPAVSGGSKDDPTLSNLFIGMGLPPITIDKDGYYATATLADGQDPDDFTFFMPAKSLVWIGKRPENKQVAAFKLTRHAGLAANGPNYDGVNVGELDDAEQILELRKGLYVNAHYVNRMPHGFDLEMGFNAAPVIYYRRAFAGITYS